MSHGKYVYESRHTYSCHTLRSLAAYRGVMSHRVGWYMFMSHTWMSHVAQGVTPPRPEDLLGLQALVESTCDAVRIWMSHVTHMNESCHARGRVMSHVWTCDAVRIHEWVMSHIWMSHVTHMNESCHTYAWVMSHIWLSHATHRGLQAQVVRTCDAVRIRGWVMSHTWMSHVTHTDESCHTSRAAGPSWEHPWLVTNTWISHVTHMKESCHIWMSHVKRESAILHIWMSQSNVNESFRAYEWVSWHL